MITTPSERRRAEEFAARLDGRSGPSSTGENSPLLDLSARLRSMELGADVDPLFRDRLRTRLLAVASVQGVGDNGARPTRSERHHQPLATNRVPRRIALAASTVTAVVALSGISMASGGANPGDTLYSVKRSREAAQLALARSDASRGQLLLQFARTRLVEAITVRDDPRELDRALDDMDNNTRAGMVQLSNAAMANADRTPLDRADEFLAIQGRQLISGLITALPQDRRARALESLTLIEQIKTRSAKLRPGLQCNAHFAGLPKSDALGVLPRPCSPATGRTPGGSTGPGRTTPIAPGGPDKRSTPQTTPGAKVKPSSGTGIRQPGGQANPTASPTATGEPLGAATDPSPDPSGGTQGMLGSVTDTVGGAVGGVVGPLSGEPPVPILP